MKIDYTKIIEAANARASALMELDTALQDSQSMILKAYEIRDHMRRVHAAWVKLDPEARTLLPESLRHALTFLNVPAFERAIRDNANMNNETGLHVLAAYGQKES